jgi:hypothetical protein
LKEVFSPKNDWEKVEKILEVKDLVFIIQILRKVYSRISLKEVFDMVKSVEVNSELLDD